MVVYSFHQNNSGGYYTEPAKNILVKNARDESHATELALGAGMYFNGVADGSDCSCCGDRWYGCAGEIDNLENAIADAIELDFGDKSMPAYIVVDGGHITADIAVDAGDRL